MKIKKVLACALALGLLTACGDDKAKEEKQPVSTEETQDVESTEESAEEPKEEEPKEEEPKEETSTALELNKELTLGDYAVTVTSYTLSKDHEGKDALIINYNWKNNSDESRAPFMTVSFKGYQDSVETDDTLFVEGADLGIGQKDVKPGGEIQGAQAVVGISDMSKPLTLELSEALSLDDTTYSTEIDLSSLQ